MDADHHESYVSPDIELPQPEELSPKEKEFASYSYLMMFASVGLGLPLPLINLGVSLGYWLYYRKESVFISFHALQSLLSQLPVTLLNGSVFVSLIVYLIRDFEGVQSAVPWYIFVGAVNLLYLVYSIIGAVRARKGRYFYFLFFGRAALGIVYRDVPDVPAAPTPRNETPEGF